MSDSERIEAELEEHRTHLRECNEEIYRFAKIRQELIGKITELYGELGGKNDINKKGKRTSKGNIADGVQRALRR